MIENIPYKHYDDLPIMLNANDIASVLGVSRAFAYTLFNAVGFPVIVIGKRKLVEKESFIQWVKGHEQIRRSI